MQEVNRVAAVLKPTTVMLKWVNQHVASPEDALSLEDIQINCSVILLPIFTDEEDAEEYLDAICPDLFAQELSLWHEDQNLWPAQRDLNTFLEWFEIEFHANVYDTLDAEDLLLEEGEEDDDEESSDSQSHSRSLQ